MMDTARLDYLRDQGSGILAIDFARASAIAATIGCSLFASFLYIFLAGNFAATLAVILGLGVVTISLFRPLISFYILLGLALLTEQYPPPESWTYFFRYHANLNTQVQALGWLPMNPMEIHLLALVIGTVIHINRDSHSKSVTLARLALLLYAGSLLFSILLGLIRGGEFLVALWEVRGIFYMIILALIIPVLVRSQDQIKVIIWIIIGCLTFRAAEVINLFRNAGWSIENGWGNHEDPGYIAGMFVFTAAMVFFKAYPAQRRTLLALAIPFLIAFIASDRRTVYGVVGVGMIIFFLMQPRDVQRKLIRPALLLLPMFLFYLILFWNSQGGILGSPARSIRESFSPDESIQTEAYTSSLYRKVEDWNLAQMIRDRSLFGHGYGTKLDFYMPIPITFSLGFWVPHNQILGIIVKTGFVGFIIFMFFYLSCFSEIASTFIRVTDPYLKAVLILTCAALANQVVYSFFDIQLNYYRNNIFAGTLLGIASVIATIATKKEEKVVEEKPPQPQPHWVVYQQASTAAA